MVLHFSDIIPRNRKKADDQDISAFILSVTEEWWSLKISGSDGKMVMADVYRVNPAGREIPVGNAGIGTSLGADQKNVPPAPGGVRRNRRPGEWKAGWPFLLSADRDGDDRQW